MRSTVRRSASFTAVAVAAGLLIGAAPSPAGAGGPAPVVDFDPVTRYTVSGAVAEIVATTPDGGRLVYTDSETAEIGFVASRTRRCRPRSAPSAWAARPRRWP